MFYLLQKQNIIYFNNWHCLLFLFLFLISSVNSDEIKKFEFNTQNYRAGRFAFNSNGDMIIEYSFNNYRLFFGLKKSGKYFFKDEANNEILTKEIKIENRGDDYLRYESQNIFISISADKQYLFSIGIHTSITELYDFETGEYLFESTNNFLGNNTIFSYIFSLFELPSDNYPKKYLLIYFYEKKHILQIISFSGFSLNVTIQSNYDSAIVSFNNRILSSFIMDSLIILFYVDNDNEGKYYKINLYDFDLVVCGNSEIDRLTDFNEIENETGMFSKCFYLKDKYSIFLYYKGTAKNSLTLKIGQINNNNSFSEILSKSINEYNFQTEVRMNDLVKLNEERLAFLAFKENAFSILTILLFDFYNDYKNLNIREFEISLGNLEAFIEITGNIFNNILVFSSTVKYKGDGYFFSIFMMFGYANGTDDIIDISEYFMDNNSNNNDEINLVTKLTENIIIDYNIFGYKVNFDNIKLVLIPNEILFFNSINENLKLNNNDILNKNYLLKQNEEIIKNDEYYYLDYQVIIQEPDYDTFNNQSKNIINYSIEENKDQKNYFEPKQFYGRTNRIKFKLCHNSCTRCTKFVINEENLNKCYSESTSIIIPNTIQSIIQKNITDCLFNTDLINQECFLSTENKTEIYNFLKSEIIEIYPPNGKSLVIEVDDNYVFHLTNEVNELKSLLENSENKYNLSKIDLGNCEQLLKAEYDIQYNLSLIILKFEKLTNIASEKNVQYEIYEPYNKTKLDLSICQNSSIDLYIPIKLSNEVQNLYEDLQEYGYDLFNINDAFYQDICTPYKTKNGTDILLSDRKTDYYYNNNNVTACQTNCEYSLYSYESKLLKCECNVVNYEDIDIQNIEKFNAKNIYKSFYDVLKYSNYKVLKCYKLVFNINSITKNKGSIITLAYFSIYLIFLVIFIFRGLNPLKIDIINFYIEKKNEKSNNPDFNNNKVLNENSVDNEKNDKEIYKKKYNEQSSIYENFNSCKKLNFPPKKKLKSKKSLKKKHKKKKSKILINQTNIKFSYKYDTHPSNTNKNIIKNNEGMLDISNKIKQKDISIYKKDSIGQSEDIEKKNLDNFELNELEYDEAIKLDKRQLYQIYWSLLMREHLILFTFFSCNDYNIIYIKFARFIFLVCTDMAMNVIFFSDDSMHKIYLNYGKYNFIQQIPQIIYSTIISQLLEIFLCYLCMTDKHIYKIKNIQKSEKIEILYFKILRCIKIKLISFFIFTFILFILYWYFISCFCAVYQNTQITFIKDSFSSFLTGLIYPFVLYLFPSALRVISLKNEKKRLKFLYKLSDIIPFF